MVKRPLVLVQQKNVLGVGFDYVNESVFLSLHSEQDGPVDLFLALQQLLYVNGIIEAWRVFFQRRLVLLWLDDIMKQILKSELIHHYSLNSLFSFSD